MSEFLNAIARRQKSRAKDALSLASEQVDTAIRHVAQRHGIGYPVFYRWLTTQDGASKAACEAALIGELEEGYAQEFLNKLGEVA